MGPCLFPIGNALAAAARRRHISFRPFIPNGRCSQGGVKVPTGGKGRKAQARERLRSGAGSQELVQGGRVSRFGATPKPTVKVRMKENGREAGACFAQAFSFRVP